jgi:hypothetical protein
MIASILAVCRLAPRVAAQPAIAQSAATLVGTAPVQLVVPNILDAMRDGTGRIWGITNDKPENYLLRRDGKAWIAQQFAVDKDGAWPLYLNGGSRGAVLCLWTCNSERYWLSEHRGTSSRLLVSFEGTDQNPVVRTDVAGRLWLTMNGKDIYRLVAGKMQRVYSITPPQMQRSGRREHFAASRNPLQATVDGRGHVWFWSDALAGWIGRYSLRGVLVFDGKKFTHYPTLPGLPQKPFSFVARKDARHLWIGVEGDGLYVLDIISRRARRVPDPALGAFLHVHNIVPSGHDWYLIASTRDTDWPDGDDAQGTCHLWRLRAASVPSRRTPSSSTGLPLEHWQKLLSGIDKAYEDDRHLERPLLRTAEGVWLGAFGRGIWFLPANGGAPISIDWRRGFPLSSVHRLMLLPDRRLLAVDTGDWSDAAILQPSRLVARPAMGRALTFPTYSEMVLDARGRVWRVLSLRDNALSEWNGARWRRHPVPPGYPLSHLGYLATDSRHRIWLVPDFRMGPAPIFDPVGNTWQVFPTYQAALQAHRSQGPSFRLGQHEEMAPRFSRDGRICFSDTGAGDWTKSRVHFFDGKTWRRWSRQEIRRAGPPGALLSDNQPFFNRVGNLCLNSTVNEQRISWEWTRAKGWRTVPYQSDPVADQVLRQAQSIKPPADCVTTTPESIIRDNRGAVWFTWNRNLYKAMYGLCMPQFAPGQSHPFLDRRGLTRVLIDRKGNAFLSTQFGGDEYVMLPGSAPPDTRVQIVQNAIDSFTIKFSSNAKDLRWFRWRLDDGSWSEPTTTARVRLDLLPGGRHRVAVSAMDRTLQSDPTPAVVTFAVNIDPARQIAAFIADLSAPDYERREAAIRGLAKQPARALPALKAAHQKADADQRWWIDAAIQQIEETNLKAGQKSGVP